MIEQLNFTPASSYTVSASTSSTNQALTQPPNISGSAGQVYGGGNAGGYTVITVYNATNGTAFLNPAMASATATLTSPFLVAPGLTFTFNMTAAYTNIAVILSAGATSGNVYIMLGSGS
jgi:hypothetical protein